MVNGAIMMNTAKGMRPDYKLFIVVLSLAFLCAKVGAYGSEGGEMTA
jgi:hypothetical protein